MGKQDELAKLQRQLRDQGIEIVHCCVVDDGVSCHADQYAAGFAEHDDKKLVRVDGQVSGWLAKNNTERAG